MEKVNGNKRMVKYCPNCGAKLDEQIGPVRYCHNCGAKLDGDTEKSKEIQLPKIDMMYWIGEAYFCFS